MSTDDGLRHRIPNTIESSSDAPSTSPISNDDDARQQPDRDEAMIETAVFHLQNTTDQPPLPDATLQVRQLRFHELMNEAFANFRTILSAFNQTLTAPVRLAFGRNTLQIGTAGNGTHGLEWGVAFEGNNWNEREVLDEFVNPNPSQIHNFRQRMFRTIFTKIVLIFVLTLPSRVRKMFEYSLLIAAIICLFTLTYLHVVFVRRPRNCLEAVPVNWTTDGILRLEIMPKADQLALYGQSLIALDHLSVKPTTQTSSIRSKETFVHEDFDRSNYSSVFERIGALSGNQQIDLHKTTFENNQTIDRQREKYSESDTQPSSGSRLGKLQRICDVLKGLKLF